MKNEKHGLFRLISFLKQQRALTALITCVLIVNMLITASVAWFSLNRTTDADDIGMSLAVDDT